AVCVALPTTKHTASMAVTGNGSVEASYSTSPTSCLSWSRLRPACSSSWVRTVRVESVMWPLCRGTHNVCNSGPNRWTICTALRGQMDTIDTKLLDLFAHEPRIGVLEASRRLGVARGTVQARLDKLAASGVVTG